MVCLVYDDHAPKVTTHLRHQTTAMHRIDGGEDVLVLGWSIATIQQFTECRVTQYLAKGR